MVHTIVEEDVATVTVGIWWNSRRMARKYPGQAAQLKRQGATVLESAEEEYADTNGLVARMDPTAFGFFSRGSTPLRVPWIEGVVDNMCTRAKTVAD